MKKIHARQLTLKNIHATAHAAARKFPSPPPPITFLMVHPLINKFTKESCVSSSGKSAEKKKTIDCKEDARNKSKYLGKKEKEKL